jgi:ubiquinone/menaquinone biosynthesis C-methylase UbiE
MLDTRLETEDPNICTYNSPEVASYYAALDTLTPCEQTLFEEFLQPGASILDLGVGGGRTTPYLSSIASRYVGIDYASEMIVRCRRKFPELEFAVGHAADLSQFRSSSFDAAVMAFNGMDYVIPDEARLRALREIRRVLKASGLLIFSSHNPRAIAVRPSWNPKRVRSLAAKIARSDSMLFRPILFSLNTMRVALAWAQAAFHSAVRVGKRLPMLAFWQGEGYWVDSAHGGLKTHGSVPGKVVSELGACGFRLLRTLGHDHPRASSLYVTGWYYYVFSKSDGAGAN